MVEYKYDAWGKPIAKTGSMANTLGTLNPFRYRGYVYDEETGFYYLRSRYYCPRLCRFVNADAYLGDTSKLFHHNILVYCVNCPTIYIDEDGFTELGVQALETWKRYYPTIANADAQYPIADIVGLAGLFVVGGAYVIDGLVGLYNYCSTSVATATAVAAGKKLQNIAEGFKDFQCVEAMEAMKEYLKKKKLHGYVVTIQYPVSPGYVYTIEYDRQISRNGKHVGVEYNGLVYCNVHPYGLPYEVWVKDFIAHGERKVTKVPF